MPAGGPSYCPTTGRHLIDCDGPQETWQRMAQRSLGRVRVKGLSSESPLRLPAPRALGLAQHHGPDFSQSRLGGCRLLQPTCRSA